MAAKQIYSRFPRAAIIKLVVRSNKITREATEDGLLSPCLIKPRKKTKVFEIVSDRCVVFCDRRLINSRTKLR
jgi:hypothetical protein